jgi:hypothetical protein
MEIALLKKPKIVQHLKNFPSFYGAPRFITLFIKDLHWSRSPARWIYYIPLHLISLRSILILFTPPPTSSPSPRK